MEILWRRMALLLPLSLFGCAADYTKVLEQPEKTFTKIEVATKLKMREVKVRVDEQGNIILSARDYENLSKNLSDIYTNQKLLKENIKFYERQMFDKERENVSSKRNDILIGDDRTISSRNSST